MLLFHLHSNQRRPCKLGPPSKCNQKLFHLWTEFTPPYIFSCKGPHQKTEFEEVGNPAKWFKGIRSTIVTLCQADNQIRGTVKGQGGGQLQHSVFPADAQHVAKPTVNAKIAMRSNPTVRSIGALRS